MNVVPHCAIGSVTLPGTRHCHAAGRIGTLIISFWKLPAKPASHVDDEVLLGFEVLINTGNRRFDGAVKGDGLPIDTGEICLTFYTVCRKSATQTITWTLHHIRWNISTFPAGQDVELGEEQQHAA